MTDNSWHSATGPASLSNLGPGFDALGLCIDTHRDVVKALAVEEKGVSIDSITGVGVAIPTESDSNTASIAASAVLEASRSTGGLRLQIEKGIPLGSGIGGSAASAVAGAVAAARALNIPVNDPIVMEAALQGERVASGAIHGDNVLPSLLGGFIATTPGSPHEYQRIAVNAPLAMALILPSLSILTEEARSGLPDEVPLSSAVRNAAATAGIATSFVNGDWRSFGRCIMLDGIVEPLRASKLPGFDAARAAAVRTGAYGAALSGSGPAVFAVCAHDGHARRVATAMSDEFSKAGVDATTFVAHPTNVGAIHPAE